LCQAPKSKQTLSGPKKPFQTSKSGRCTGTRKNEVGHGKLVGRRQLPQKRLPRKVDAAPAPAKIDTFLLESFGKNNFID
jgi:hypothetical protein